MRWSLERIERACRKSLGRTRVQVAALRDHVAEVEPVANGRLAVRVDPHRSAMLDGIVHEMLHPVLEETLKAFDDECEELVVLAIEDALVRKINRSRRRTAWWRKAVRGKLPR